MPSDVAAVRSKPRSVGVPTDELIRRYQAGQSAAFDALFERYKDYVYRIAYMTLRNSDAAEEATQETFIDVMRGLKRYDVEGAARFETWLYRVAVNRCKTRLRRKTLPSADWDEMEDKLERLEVEGEAPDGAFTGQVDADPETLALRQEERVRLWRAVNRLGDVHREVVLLRYGHELSYEEIAEVLNISVGTVKSRLFNAHRKLKEILIAEAPDLAPVRSLPTLLLWLLTG